MRIAIVGASPDRSRFSNKAVRAYSKLGWEVVPVSPRYDKVEGIRCARSITDIPGPIDEVSFYVRPETGLEVAEEVIKKKIQVAYLNPGASSDNLAEKLRDYGVEVRVTCSILAAGETPDEY